MYKSELNRIKKLISDDVWEVLENHDAIIAGGAITSIFTNKEVNDIDVYLRSESDFVELLFSVMDGLAERINVEYDSYASFALIAVNYTDKSMLFVDKETGAKIQIIIYKFFNGVQEIFDDFDFVFNMGALEVKTGEFTLHENFLKHNSQRYIEYSRNTKFPLITGMRVQKYIERGYTISKSELIKVYLSINALNIDSWKTLKAHVGGMYGWNMNQVFPDDSQSTFSIDRAMEILSDLESNEKMEISPDKSVDTREVYENFKDVFDRYYKKIDENDTRLSVKGRLFKNVSYKNEKYVSTYMPSFEYPLGSVVNGGRKGIFAYDGYDVVRGTFSDTGYIVELELAETPDISDEYRIIDGSDALQLIGNVRVLGVYTKEDFIKNFKR